MFSLEDNSGPEKKSVEDNTWYYYFSCILLFYSIKSLPLIKMMSHEIYNK